MSDVTREQFLAERKDCIGGSDVADLLDLAPYGCERRLWYDKKHVPEDFPEVGDTNRHMRRGNLLEAIAIDEFCREFGYGCIGEAPPQMRMIGRPHIAAHVDRIVWPLAQPDQRRVLEQKVPTHRNFAKIKGEGKAPDSWVAQTRWNMMVAGLPEGVLSIFDASSFECLKFDIVKSDEMISQFTLVADVFWDQLNSSIQNVFKKKEDDYGECYRCKYRATCKGFGRTPTSVFGEAEKIDLAVRNWVCDDGLRSLAVEMLEAKEHEKIAKEEVETLKDLIKTLLAGRNVVTSDGMRIYTKDIVKKIKAVPAHERVETHLKVLKAE